MQSTTNYGLNIVEGTDIVNPLTQFNPNFTDIDSIMKANADASVDHATCIKTGTVHAVTRTNTGASVFRFTATGNWNTGDTMTVDGTLVSVYVSDGTSPADGCYIINTEVLASIQGTRVTLYVNSANASNVLFDNTGTGLSSNNAQDAIKEVQQNVDNVSTALGSLIRLKYYTPFQNTCAVGTTYVDIPALDTTNLIGVAIVGVTVTYSFDDLTNIVFVPSTNKIAITCTHNQDVTLRVISVHNP